MCETIIQPALDFEEVLGGGEEGCISCGEGLERFLAVGGGGETDLCGGAGSGEG